MSDDGSDTLLKVKGKVSATGASAELAIGSGLPGAVAQLLPGWAVKRGAKLLLSGQILEKIRGGLPLTDSEVLYATSVFGGEEAKLIRCQQIEARSVRVFREQDVKQLPTPSESSAPEGSDAPSSAEPNVRKTADDWVNKFWDDAGLVSDEGLQEVYARVLASEARAPGTCSLRTLGVLRYLDREAAEDFSKLAPLVFDGHFVPEALQLLPKFGVGYAAITNLVESGLLTAPSSNIVQHVKSDPAFLCCGLIILRMSQTLGASYQILPLTTAGRELLRVAQFQLRSEYVLEAVAWFRQGRPSMQVHWAEAPHLGWTGNPELLGWNASAP